VRRFELTLWFEGGFYGLHAACQRISTLSLSCGLTNG
jgi:hypothetical protein